MQDIGSVAKPGLEALCNRDTPIGEPNTTNGTDRQFRQHSVHARSPGIAVINSMLPTNRRPIRRRRILTCGRRPAGELIFGCVRGRSDLS